MAPLPKVVSPGDWLYAGIEVRLAPGAKTYWRNPGDTGVAPSIDFSASLGLAQMELDFPAPVSFDDGAGGRAIGYKESKIFPIRFKTLNHYVNGKIVLEPANLRNPPPPPPPAKLALSFEYGVCTKDMCIPASFEASIELGGGTPEYGLHEKLKQAIASIPEKQQVGRNNGFGISVIKGQRKDDSVTIEISAYVGAGVHQAELFFEARDSFTVSQMGAAVGGVILFRVQGTHTPAVSTMPKLSAEQLGPARLTLVTHEKAIEVAVDLDMVAAQR